MLGDQKDEWLAARLEDLDYGDIDGICNAARVYPLAGVKKDELDTALGYFENNAPRMRYNWFRFRGLFVGSGAVESGCKAVIGQRLKLSGMHWTVEGASADDPDLGAAASARVPVADGSVVQQAVAGQAGSVAAQARDVVRLDYQGRNAIAGLPCELQDVGHDRRGFPGHWRWSGRPAGAAGLA